MAQALDSGPVASSALAQPDKDDSVWSEAYLHICPLTHISIPMMFLPPSTQKTILHEKDVNKWTNTH